MPESQMNTGFHLYGYARAIENKALGSATLKVIPLDEMPFVSGELKHTTNQDETSGTSASGVAYQVAAIPTQGIEAIWLPFSSNRNTAPDIRRGERVGLYRYADSPTYYWVDLGLDRKLRRLETVVMMWSDIADTSYNGDLSYANTYSCQISTHEQHITFHTCKNNGEPYEYTIQLNTKDGIFTLIDDIGNFFHMVSADHELSMQNADGTYVTLKEENIDVYAPDTITVTAGKNISITAGQKITVKSKTFTQTCTDASITASASYKVTTPNAVFSNAVTSASVSTQSLAAAAMDAASGTITMDSTGITSTKPIRGPDHTI